MVDTPQQVMFSAGQVLSNKWTLLGGIGWQYWSTFSDSEATINHASMKEDWEKME